ncbi:hypothetical protein HMPREF0381_1614 [Lachnoanaerobaculum saburreum DSM 3986]|uniref:Uncharacterized protein n=1 Tax=Lachnoanaerobaculum saburreum DSM 3986 TaxID=887325 RepID=E6LNS9_9FIRM|nr:hypothetical protein HMPREF0381_1614 [Lachnoanaerobaculum saburreum DSM 3986]
MNYDNQKLFPFLIGKVLTCSDILSMLVKRLFPFLIGKVLTKSVDYRFNCK